MSARDKKQFKVWHFGIILLAGSISIFLIGILERRVGYRLGRDTDWIIGEFYPNITTELASIALTILIIDRLYEQAGVRQEKKRLIRQLGSRSNSIALNAIEELRAFGWLEDGSLQGCSLVLADLKGGQLTYADLTNVLLTGAVLNGADLKWTSLHRASLRSASLEGAILIGADLSNARLWGSNLGGSYLINTNLQNSDMRDTNLTSAILWGANLYGSNVANEQLSKAMMLTDSIMPDGTSYDGRFALKGDVALQTDKKAPQFPRQVESLPVDERLMTKQFVYWKWVEESIFGQIVSFSASDIDFSQYSPHPHNKRLSRISKSTFDN